VPRPSWLLARIPAFEFRTQLGVTKFGTFRSSTRHVGGGLAAPLGGPSAALKRPTFFDGRIRAVPPCSTGTSTHGNLGCKQTSVSAAGGAELVVTLRDEDAGSGGADLR